MDHVQAMHYKEVKFVGSYKTVLHRAEAQVEISKSRFIGYALPVTTEAEATAFVEAIKKKHKDATHTVPVYLIGEKHEIQRYSDDGEPSGTAGVPVLSMLKNEEITNVVLVITRYFGGIKLGTGGLVRAYTDTAKMALEACTIVKRQVMHLLSVTFYYTAHGKIQNMLLGLESVIIKETLFTDKVCIWLYCLPSEKGKLIEILVENTNGQALITEDEDEILTVLNGEVVSDPSFKTVL